MNRKFIFAYRILLFLLAFVGVYLEISKYGWGMLMYYTVLSNLLVLLFMGYLVYLMAHTEDAWKSPKLLRVKGGRDHVYHDYLRGLSFYAGADCD